MTKLVCNAIRCVQTTSGGGNDQIYMIIFRGSFNLPPTVKVVGGSDTAWGDVASGNLIKHDMVLDEPYHTENVYVAMMLEQDSDIDILDDSATWSKVTEIWANNWMKPTVFGGREFHALTAMASGGAFDFFDNDDLIGVRVIPQIFTDGGTGTLIKFEGDGGSFRTRFVRRP